MRKKHPEHVNLERWLVSYADFITLLFAFFVIMYATSQSDLAKFKTVAAGIRQAFSSGAAGVPELSGMGGGDTTNPFEMAVPTMGRIADLPVGKSNTAADPDPEIVGVKELLEESVSLEVGATEVSEKLQMHYDSRGLVIRIATKDFFDEGGIQVRQDLRPILDRIARIVLKSTHPVRIEGHTDADEVLPSGYRSGWELSSARAGWVAEYLIKKFDPDPARIGVGGYSHYRPLTERRDIMSRAKNRRVEIILLNN